MKNLLCATMLWTLVAGCKEKYNPPVSSPPTGYLVVEGFINSGTEPTTITLSRTTTLYDSVNNNSQVFENNAEVSIESNADESFPLSETGNGVYTSSSQLLNSNEQYRIHIITTDGKEYVSDYTPVKSTPPIDSLSWTRNSDGIHIAINTHDPQNNTRYYQWEDEETWEFHSAFSTSLVYSYDPSNDSITGVVFRSPDTQAADSALYKCWHSPHSTSILIGTSEKLSEDKIFYPLIDIPAGSQQLSVLYSLIVKQHTVSKDNYSFLQKMKKNTESVGSIFDAQPSELKGNIHCVNNPSEPVVGYMEVSQIQSQRIFISHLQVPDWGYTQPCQEKLIANNTDDIMKNGLGLSPTNPAMSFGNTVISFYASEAECVDCRLSGSNIKPDFWP